MTVKHLCCALSTTCLVLLFCVSTIQNVEAMKPPKNCQELGRRYNYIFPHRNRNAASHLWSSHLLDMSEQMSVEEFVELNKCFCSVSGSPVRPSDYNRYGLLLNFVGKGNTCGAQVFGFMHYCCWPCVCDTQDFIRVDTKTIKFKGGVEKELTFAVIGDPCRGPGIKTEQDLLNVEVPDSFGRRRGMSSTVGYQAPEISCDTQSDGSLKLHGAHFSDNGFPIISMFFDPVSAPPMDEKIKRKLDKGDHRFLESLPRAPEPGRTSYDPKQKMYQHHYEFSKMCKERIVDGVATSGMGDIFRVIAGVSKICDG